MTSPLWVYAIGFVGMALYGVRLFVQWYMSAKAHKVVSPGIYWVMSSIGAVVLYLYGWLRKDFSIIFGESIGYYIYMWNISILGLYKKVPKFLIVLQALFPVVIIGLIVKDFPQFNAQFLENSQVPPWLLLYGVLGQFVYEIRSLYQLIYSVKRQESILPLGHWILAVIGSAMTLPYCPFRPDLVPAIAHFSLFFAIRNLMLSIANLKDA